MTKPDREELVKLNEAGLEAAVRECAHITAPEITNDEYERIKAENSPRYQNTRAEMARTIRAYLASSDGGVKGEPVAWHVEGHSPFSSRDVARRYATPFNPPQPLYTAPPADAGMREALEQIRTVCDEPFSYGRSHIANKIAAIVDAALTSPGATTKSDGINPVRGAESASGAHVADRTGGATPPTGATNPLAGKVPCHCHDPVSRRLCLDKDRCCTVEAQPVQAIKMPEYRYQEEDQRGGSVTFGGPTVPTLVDDPNSASGKRVEHLRPSDPSSTRSEVTVEDEPPENTTVGGITWHSSEEDSGPDVGISVYLGPDDWLWCGEISRSLFEQHDGPARFENDLGAFIVRYTGKETTLIAKCADMDTGREFIEQIAEWVRKAALLDQFEIRRR